MVNIASPNPPARALEVALGSDAAARERIVAAVDRAFATELAYLEDIVRIPSTRGQEARVQDFIHDDLARRGYDMDRWLVRADDLAGHPGASPAATPLDQAWCVVGAHRPRRTVGRSLILNAHIDVVPAGPLSMWTSPPFAPETRDGWMYGRGAGDMKAGAAINLFAMEAIRAAGYAPAANVFLETVPEEESTGNGALSSLVRGYRADAWLCTEPTGERIIRGNCGVVWFKISVIGTPAHTSEMQAGFNAIDAIYRLVGALRDLEAEWNRPENRHPLLAGFEHPLNLNLAQIRGGDWTSMVPAWCEAELRFAMYPGQSAAWVRQKVEACVARAAAADRTLANNPPKVEWHGFFCEGYELPRDTPAEATLAACHGAITGTPLGEGVLNAYLDARVPALYGGMPALVYGPKGEKAHGFDERVDLESIRRCTKTVALFIAEWCGLESR